MHSYRVDLLTSGQVAEHLAERPAVILPLGGSEPFGGIGGIGVETLCAERIANELSTRCRILSAPTLPYGCSTPFMAFPGAAGVKPRTFINLLCEIIHSYILQGAKRIFLINAAPFNKTPAAEAAKRIEKKYAGAKIFLFNLNELVYGADGADNADRIDRADAALLAIARYLKHEPANFDTSSIKSARVTPNQYRAWRKRGADPQKLRKLFPDGLLLPQPDDGAPIIDITPERGKELFDRAVTSIQEQIALTLT